MPARTITKAEARRILWGHLALTLSGETPGCEAHGGVAMMTPNDDCQDCQRIAEVATQMEGECFARSTPPNT